MLIPSLELRDALADPLRKARLSLLAAVVRHDEPVSLGVRTTYRRENTDLPGTDGEAVDATPKRTLSKRWRELIYRIYEVDPLTCSRCGARMKILAFIIEPAVIGRILDHLDRSSRPRAPPGPTPSY